MHGRGIREGRMPKIHNKVFLRFKVVDRRVWDADEEYGDVEEVVEGAGAKYLMSPALRDLAHQYALSNLSLMAPWHK